MAHERVDLHALLLGHHVHADLDRGERGEQLGAHEVAEGHVGFGAAGEQRATFRQTGQEFAGTERVVQQAAAVGVHVVGDGRAEQGAVQHTCVNRLADSLGELAEQADPSVEVGGEVVGVAHTGQIAAGVVTKSTSGWRALSLCSRTTMAKMEVPAETLPVRTRTELVATMPVPASPQAGRARCRASGAGRIEQLGAFLGQLASRSAGHKRLRKQVLQLPRLGCDLR